MLLNWVRRVRNWELGLFEVNPFCESKADFLLVYYGILSVLGDLLICFFLPQITQIVAD